MIRRLKNWVVLDKDKYNYVRFSQGFPIKQVRGLIRYKNMRHLYPLKTTCNIPPKHIAIETTNFCNTYCAFCPHPKMKREKQNMDMKLYKKVIDDSIDLGVKKVTLSFFGEPLMDEKLFKRIKYAKEKGLFVEFFTNGMLIDRDKAWYSILSDVDRIFISLDATNPIRYRELRANGDYNAVVTNIERLLHLKTHNLKIDIGMLILKEEDKKEIKEFQENWRDKVNEIHIRTAHGWGTNPKRKLNLPCYSLWNTFAVLSNGKVVPCCMDYEGILSIGDANKESLSDIWYKSLRLKHLRNVHLMGLQDKVELCKNCDIVESLTDPWWYYD